jgi:hypothetical protein
MNNGHGFKKMITKYAGIGRAQLLLSTEILTKGNNPVEGVQL